jgi:hypothetical protein
LIILYVVSSLMLCQKRTFLHWRLERLPRWQQCGSP